MALRKIGNDIAIMEAMLMNTDVKLGGILRLGKTGNAGYLCMEKRVKKGR